MQVVVIQYAKGLTECVRLNAAGWTICVMVSALSWDYCRDQLCLKLRSEETELFFVPIMLRHQTPMNLPFKHEE